MPRYRVELLEEAEADKLKMNIAVKDPNAAHPVADDWRDALRRIVDALVHRNYQLAGVAGVTLASPKTPKQIEDYVAEYGETLVPLPEESWDSSGAQWMDGYWDVLVDLWTQESGESDLVLTARVFEDGGSFRVEVQSVHVP